MLGWIADSRRESRSLIRSEKYLKSLDDERSVWLKGKRIKVYEHEAFQGTLQTISALFDMLDDPVMQKQVGYPSPKTGEYVHTAFLVPKGPTDLQQRKAAFESWSEATDGMMSRLSDYARSRLAGWYAARKQLSRHYRDFSEKITRYYETARDQNRFITIVQRDVQINRSKQYDERCFEEAGLLRVTKKTTEGVYVSGAKMIATAAPYTNDFLVYPVMKLNQAQKSAANLFIVPADAKGLHIVCRESYAKPLSEKNDFPLSAQFDEMDALLIFDQVLIPWEHVLLLESPEGIWEVKTNPHSASLAYHQALIRLKTKLQFITGLACKIADTIGCTQFLHVQDKLGELIGQVETIHAILLAAESEGRSIEDGVYLPRFSAIETGRNLGAFYYPRAIEILQLIAAGGLIQVPASIEDFQSALSPLMKTYFRGANLQAEKRVRLFKLAWDVIGSPFASRHELYERFYAGDPIRNRAAQYLSSNKRLLLTKIEKYLSN
ncbi:4-hydroxyphenylacetate 3-hydroxylase family protein [Salinithrix halophila]|uniref:4-hydroxyphenylacetate 3-hydroxylase family protein n=1 Tax=Salinithrix halophila TaxID=1485204 RepID=A0ABV8JAZ5_9BACL